mmetsp:Transcript_27525/g.49627  ORF Transcript_27525/g.49627 Transcript_27525/m.49627 type:complete len:248 (+) Transcript_27525:629-1372(+)
MLRSQYDSDCLTWSPQGRLFQVEYAMEAVKQGSLSLALRSNTHVVLASLARTPNKLAEHQKKINQVDEHLGLSFSGLTADARLISKFMRTEALNHRYAYGTPINPGRLVFKLSEKAQIKTHRVSKRPYGVGCLIAGVDDAGPHIYETNPDGNFYEFYAHAIGARCQSAKTYLEKNFDSFSEATTEQLIDHAVRAIKKSTQGETELTGLNVTIAVVGLGEAFRILSEEEVLAYVKVVEQEAQKMDLEH